METKTKDMESRIYHGVDPPPYPGPPGPGPSYPPNSGYPVTSQSHVTVVHPGNATVIQGATVIPAVVITNRMGPESASSVCPSCNQHIVTRVERIPSMRTHLFAAVLCLVGFWPCVCIPYCVDSCNNANHYCPNCNAYIGSYSS